MDEIILDEKKYISSKQAAKLTGYAKDYVGQLCREGRVQARLVGRSWYVLESSIKDHRFGSTTDTSENVSTHKAKASVWEPPRYEPVEREILPPVQRLKVVEEKEREEVAKNTISRSHIQESWDAWFNLVEEEIQTVPTAVDIEVEPVSEKEESVQRPPEGSFDVVPARKQSPSTTTDTQGKKRARRAYSKVLVVLLLSLASVAISLAAINTGYLDSQLYSFEQAHLITGILVYIK